MTVDAMTIINSTVAYTAVQQSEPAVYAANANEVESVSGEAEGVLFGLLLSAPLLLTIAGAVWVGVKTLG